MHYLEVPELVEHDHSSMGSRENASLGSVEPSAAACFDDIRDVEVPSGTINDRH
jgi:hypothetical protein